MSSSTNKTIPTANSVIDFINLLQDKHQIKDSLWLVDTFKKITGKKPVMWGSSIIGFGSYHYKYDSGREGDACALGFSPRKGNLSIYILSPNLDLSDELKHLGESKQGKACLYIKNLDRINKDILTAMITKAYHYMKTNHQTDL